jgi:predicted nuclease with RNAse H fold
VRYLGIDISATRGLDMALLDESGALSRLSWVDTVSALKASLQELGTDLIVGIDAPSDYAIQAGGREVERQLGTLGVSSYPTPTNHDRLDEWVKTGFAVWRTCRDLGLVEHRALAVGPGVIEVYPYLAYVAWSGARRPREEVSMAWAKRLLKEQGFSLPDWAIKDHADATAAALVAKAFSGGVAVPYGDIREGTIWSPSRLAAAAPPLRSARSFGSALCLCPCGRPTSGRPGVRYLPGHDMKDPNRHQRKMT